MSGSIPTALQAPWEDNILKQNVWEAAQHYLKLLEVVVHRYVNLSSAKLAIWQMFWQLHFFPPHTYLLESE